jgi:hypothetical protein
MTNNSTILILSLFLIKPAPALWGNKVLWPYNFPKRAAYIGEETEEQFSFPILFSRN